MHSVHRLHMVSVHIDHHRRLAFRTLNKLFHCLSVRPLVMSIRSVFVDDIVALLREDIFDFVSSSANNVFSFISGFIVIQIF